MKDLGRSSSRQRVTDVRQARVLMDRVQLRLLGAFMGRARGVAEAARDLDVSTEWLYRRVRRFHSLGLLVPVDRQVRAGRPITRYRTTADTYFISSAVLPLQQSGRANRAYHAALFEVALGRNMQQPPFDTQDWGAQTGWAPNGDPYLEIAHEDGTLWPTRRDNSPVIVSGWNVLHLGSQDARRLQDELLDLYRRYAPLTGSQTYLFGLFLTAATDLPGLEHPSHKPPGA